MKKFLTSALFGALFGACVVHTASAQAQDLTASAASLIFANTELQTRSPAQEITLTAASALNVVGGQANLIAFTAVGVESSNFTLTPGSPPCNATLAAGATCKFLLTFTPTVVGIRYAQLVINTNSTVTPQIIIPLQGSSTATPDTNGQGGAMPGVPTNVSATSGNLSATVSFTPDYTGTVPIQYYMVTTVCGTSIKKTSTSLTSIQITGLANGTECSFTVTATNTANVTSPSSPAVRATPVASPFNAPTILNVSAGNASAIVTFEAPTQTGGGIIGYTVTSTPGGFTDTNAGGSPNILSRTVNALSNGTSYTFKVTASNGVTTTTSAASNSVIPALTPIPPGAPTNVMAFAGAAGSGQATVSFSEPTSSGGATITGYAVSGGGTDSNAGSATLSHLITGLAPGNYVFTVKATNSAGAGLASAASNSVTVEAASNGGNDALCKSSGLRNTVPALDWAMGTYRSVDMAVNESVSFPLVIPDSSRGGRVTVSYTTGGAEVISVSEYMCDFQQTTYNKGCLAAGVQPTMDFQPTGMNVATCTLVPGKQYYINIRNAVVTRGPVFPITDSCTLNKCTGVVSYSY